MKAEVLSKFNQPWLPVTAQILFLCIFLGVIYYAFRKQNQILFMKQALMPLQEDLLVNPKIEKEADHE